MRHDDDSALTFPAPAGPRLLVKVLDESDRHDHHLFLPDGAVTDKPDRGVVMHVGPGYLMPTGYVALAFEPGDEIVFFRERGVPIEIDGQELLILREDHVLVVLSPAPETGDWP